MIIIGTLKGNGAGFTKLLERLIRGAWTPTAMEFMQPSLWVLMKNFDSVTKIIQNFISSYTKASVVAAIIFVLDKKSDLISAPHALVYFGIVIFLVYFKLSSLLLGIHGEFHTFYRTGTHSLIPKFHFQIPSDHSRIFSAPWYLAVFGTVLQSSSAAAKWRKRAKMQRKRTKHHDTQLLSSIERVQYS